MFKSKFLYTMFYALMLVSIMPVLVDCHRRIGPIGGVRTGGGSSSTNRRLRNAIGRAGNDDENQNGTPSSAKTRVASIFVPCVIGSGLLMII